MVVSFLFFFRDTGDEESNDYVQHRKLYDKVISNIRSICKRVNQVIKTLNRAKKLHWRLVANMHVQFDWTVAWPSEVKNPNTLLVCHKC